MPAGEWEAVALNMQGEVCEPSFEASRQRATIRLHREHVEAVEPVSFRHGGYPHRDVVLQMRAGDANYRGIRLHVVPTHDYALGVCCVVWVKPDAGPLWGMVAISAFGGVSAGLVQWVREELGRVREGVLGHHFRQHDVPSEVDSLPFDKLAALQRLGGSR